MSHHLEVYQKFVRITRKLPEDISESDLDEACFPLEQKKLELQAKLFVMWVFRLAGPRSQATGGNIQYRSLTKYVDLHHP